MRRRSVLAAWLLAHAATALAAGPLASGATARPECVDAMRLAKATYASTAPHLYAPPGLPDGMESTLTLDIAGDDELDSTSEFEKVPHQIGTIYWAARPQGGRRIVLLASPLGWRGDYYDLYLLDATVEQADFPGVIPGLAPVIHHAWRPPLVFQRDKTGGQWFIDVGQPSQTLASWTVYVPDQERPLCTIAFRPKTQPLPGQLVAFVGKLDETLGSGQDEGTLQPTARLRLRVAHMLANAALRPWALSPGDAYSSRHEVERGLKEWSSANRSRLRLYGKIREAYPRAEQSLASYYAQTFGLPRQKSSEVAAWVMDLVFRAHFVFSSDGEQMRKEGVQPNPWP